MSFSISLHRSIERGEFQPLDMTRSAAKPDPEKPVLPLSATPTHKAQLPVFNQ